jgi:hypothetical protein
MITPLTLEERVAMLEAEVARLKRLVAAKPASNWLEKIDGSMKDEPAFDEVIRLGREFREADRPADTDEPADDVRP